ncbi:MAG TPA: PLP-dependent aspartate aminotransferase family protein [Rubricoccaceae bacterium]|nr:PLP-dependent aspartate aminotransferase family protein [Rubricoccaceae bacterium]
MAASDRPLDLTTLAVHAGRGDLAALGVHAPPIDLSTTYPFADPDEATRSLDALTRGAASASNPVYARLHNPTVARFEAGLAALEGTEAAVAFASGMAALAAVVMALRTNEQRHVVGVRPLYGSNDTALSGSLLGVETTWTTADGVAAALRDDTVLVVVETPVNPTLDLHDIADVVRQAGGPDGVPVLVDSTFGTPVLQRPAALGATYVLHSATKFLGGHGDVIAGVVACAERRAVALRHARVYTGALLHPLAAYLLHRGLPTLPLRVLRMQATAQALAERLAAHPAVSRVYYPGLPDGDPRGLLGRQMAGPGPMVSFELAGGFAAADRLMRGLRLIIPAVSLGATETLIQHPAGLTHRVVSEEVRVAGRITGGLLRLSVGLEAADDLWNDLEAALG